MTRSDSDYFAAQATNRYFQMNALRARGDLPEKQSTNAAAQIILANKPDTSDVLDAGCSAGHLLRSLLLAGLPITHYSGIDLDEPAIQAAREIWQSTSNVVADFDVHSISNIPFADDSFDVVVSLNVVEHMKSLRPSLSEVVRVARNLVLIRTFIYESSYIIQEVRNSDGWSHDDSTYAELPSPADELMPDGTPVSFVYQNYWGRTYLEACVREIAPDATILIVPDSLFSAEALASDAAVVGLPNAERMVGEVRMMGPISAPNHWVLIGLDGRSLSIPA